MAKDPITIGHYPHLVRHTGPRDFTKDLVQFDQIGECVRCGAKPEDPHNHVCNDCMGKDAKALSLQDKKRAIRGAAKTAQQRKGKARKAWLRGGLDK